MTESERPNGNSVNGERTVTADSANNAEKKEKKATRATVSFEYQKKKTKGLVETAPAHRSYGMRPDDKDRLASDGQSAESSDKSDDRAQGKRFAILGKVRTIREKAAARLTAKSSGQASPDTGIDSETQLLNVPEGSVKKNAAAANAKPAKKKKSENNSTPPKKASKGKRRLWIFFRAFIISVLMLVIIGGIAGGAYTAYIISHAPTIHPERIYDTLDVSSHIYDDKENLIDEIYYSENRQIITYEQLPANLKNAFIAIEDKTFWKHSGFNFKRIFGAVFEKLKGGRISGTSTITQQLARNVFQPEDKSKRSMKRKITEMYYAYEIEQALSKEEILTAYLNTIYLGYGCYGVDTAARTYFSTSVENLTLEQCAALAALPYAPDKYALLSSEEAEDRTKLREGLYANDASQNRRDLILQLMEVQGYITAEEREAATKPVTDFIKPGGSSIATKSAFKDYLIETVKQDLMREYDLTEEQASKMLYTKGLKIYSTLSTKTQKVITEEFAKSENFPSAGKSPVEGAMVVTEVGTGKIKAMVGSRKASGQMLFNRAINARQPGSSIKPLSVYAPALQKSFEYRQNGQKFKFTDFGYDKQGAKGWGDYITVASIVADQRMVINGTEWPHNVTRSYSGKNTFRTALQKSINTCAVKILAQVGISYSMDMLQSFGISTAVDDSDESYNDLNYSALGLGAMTKGVTPLEMSLAYAAFPNRGVRNTPVCYTRVEDNNGSVILESKSESVKVMDEGVAWIMTDVLKSVVSHGIAGSAAVEGVRVGGKTGTTDDRFDIWFSGFTPQLSAALWIGTDENVRMDSGSDVAAKLWSKIMSRLKRSKQGEYPGMPGNIVIRNGEYFTAGTEPPEKKKEDEDKDKDKDKDNKDKPSLIDLLNGWSDDESDIFEPDTGH